MTRRKDVTIFDGRYERRSRRILIVRDKPSAWHLLVVMRGSIVPTIAARLAGVTLLSVAVVALQGAGLIRLHDLAALGDGGAAEMAAARNPSNMLLAVLTRDAAAAAGLITPRMLQILEERPVSASAVLAAAERIRNVPVPHTYSLILHRTAYLFCILPPFGPASTAGPWTPLVVLIVSYTFFGLDALEDELERPFGTGQNGLPIDAMARGMGIDVRELLGEPVLREPLRPVDYVLT